MRNGFQGKWSPGAVRDSILESLKGAPEGRSVEEIQAEVTRRLGPTPPSSVRSYLRLNTPQTFCRVDRGRYALTEDNDFASPAKDLNFDFGGESNGKSATESKVWVTGRSRLVLSDCLLWMREQQRQSVHAVVTDPPYGLIEYTDREQAKLRAGKGGVWRIPPSFDGHQRSPLPRFTVLKQEDIVALGDFFYLWARTLFPILVPGAHVLIASNPLLSYVVASAVVRAGFERRGEIIRLTMTMRGGDRPKAAHEEFPEVSVMPRSMWEPWLIFRKPLEGRVQDNLRKWSTGGFRRPGKDQPFGDVIESAPTRATERALAPHPSLKPQAFLRQLVRAVLPLGTGVILDPFAGGGSTLAAAEAVGYESIGVERDGSYFKVACEGIPKLAALRV
jgi:site-specific DNA-methyltransferase (adenine-specific)